MQMRHSAALGTLSLGAILLVAYGGGLHNRAVAEDFFPATAFMHLGPGLEFRPAFALPMMALERLFGFVWETPFVFHVYVLVLHLCSTLVLVLLCRRLGMSRGASFTGGLAFALYPRHAEPILWPAGSAHMVMTLFGLLSVVSYIAWRATKSFAHLAISLALFTLALLANEAGIAWVGVLMAFHVFIDTTPARSLYDLAKHIVRRVYPFFIVTLGYGLTIALVSRHAHMISGRSDTTFYHVTFDLQQITNSVGYISYALVPFIPLRSLDGTGKLLMLATAVILGSGLAVFGDKRAHFGLLWFVAGLVPYVLFVPYGNADRYFYLASAGLCITVAALADRWLITTPRVLNVRSRLASTTAVTALVTVYALAAILTARARVSEWRQAGENVRDMFAQLYSAYPAVEPNERFYFVNVPKKLGSAMFMGAGWQWALRTHYGSNQIVASGGDGEELVKAVQNTDRGHTRLRGTVVMTYEHGRLVDRSSSYLEPQTQALLALTANEPR